MSRAIAGISVIDFEDAIHDGLEEYEKISEGRIQFDLLGAIALKPEPNEPFLAESFTPVHFDGIKGRAADLTVRAFQPGESTGKVEPRPHTYSEVLLTLGQISIDKLLEKHNAHDLHEDEEGDDDEHPELEEFEGNFNLIGLKNGRPEVVGELGHPRHLFRILHNKPRATHSVGIGENGVRFGDPRAIHSPVKGVIQLAGFVAQTEKQAARFPDLIPSLKPQPPILFD